MTEERIRALGNRIGDIMDELRNICRELQMSIHVDSTWHSKYNEESITVFIHLNDKCFQMQNRENLLIRLLLLKKNK